MNSIQDSGGAKPAISFVLASNQVYSLRHLMNCGDVRFTVMSLTFGALPTVGDLHSSSSTRHNSVTERRHPVVGTPGAKGGASKVKITMSYESSAKALVTSKVRLLCHQAWSRQYELPRGSPLRSVVRCCHSSAHHRRRLASMHVARIWTPPSLPRLPPRPPSHWDVPLPSRVAWTRPGERRTALPWPPTGFGSYQC